MPQDDAAHNIAIDAAAAATADAASAKRARRIAKTMETVVAAQRRLPPGEVLPTQTIACETCGETFARKQGLARHQRANRCFWRERADTGQQQAMAPTPTPAPAPGLPCETCGDTFASKRALVVHQRDYRCFWRERAAAAYRQSVADSHFADSLDEYVANVLARPAPTPPPPVASVEHVCASCGKRLGSRQALATHVRLDRCVDHRTAAGKRCATAANGSSVALAKGYA